MQSLIVQSAFIEPTALLLCPLSANVVQTNMIAAVIADNCFVAVSLALIINNCCPIKVFNTAVTS